MPSLPLDSIVRKFCNKLSKKPFPQRLFKDSLSNKSGRIPGPNFSCRNIFSNNRASPDNSIFSDSNRFAYNRITPDICPLLNMDLSSRIRSRCWLHEMCQQDTSGCNTHPSFDNYIIWIISIKYNSFSDECFRGI